MKVQVNYLVLQSINFEMVDGTDLNQERFTKSFMRAGVERFGPSSMMHSIQVIENEEVEKPVGGPSAA